MDDETVRPNLIYEDKYAIAFLYDHPMALGHTIVAPRRHFKDVFEFDNAEEFAQVMALTHRVSLKLREVLGASGVNLLSNNGTSAGQEVMHFHLHIVPRKENDGRMGFVRFSGKESRIRKREISELRDKLALGRH